MRALLQNNVAIFSLIKNNNKKKKKKQKNMILKIKLEQEDKTFTRTF